MVVWQKLRTKGFEFFGEAASSARSEGVGSLISLPFAGSVQQLPSDFVGQVWIKLTTKGEALFVCSVYMPQASDEGAPKAFRALQDSISHYAKEGSVVVLGDFNAHVHSDAEGFGEHGEKRAKSCANGELLENLLLESGLCAANCRCPTTTGPQGSIEYTRKDPVSGLEAVLDYVLVSAAVLGKSAGAVVDADQVCNEWVMMRVEAGAKKVTRTRRAKRGFRHAWFDDEVRAAVKAKQSAFAAKELSGSESDQVEYIKLREACNELVRRKKKTSWADLLAKLSDEFTHHPRLFFSTLGQVAGVKAGADAIGPVRDADGSLQVEEDDKRDAMASFYEKLGKAVKVSSPLTEDQRTNGAAFQTRFDDDFRKEVDQKVVGLLKNTKNVRGTFGRGRERQRSKRLSNDRFKVQEIQRVLETLRLVYSLTG